VSASTTVYDTRVTAVGAQVPAFLDHGIIVLFADTAPPELHDISVLHEAAVTDDGPLPGDTLVIGPADAPEHLEVLAVGSVVRDNLLNLGHLDIKADGRTEPKLPGDVCVRTGPLPTPAEGDVFRITREQA